MRKAKTQAWASLFKQLVELKKKQAALSKGTQYYCVVPNDPKGIKCAATLAAIYELDNK